jgi:N-methylhydantoinase A
MGRRIRVGIDVGGTFTKAVAIDMGQSKVIGKATTPTTHSSREGVSKGIITALRSLMYKYNIKNPEIELIAHSTTQAVNALLEGDTAKVGVIGMGVGLEKSNVIRRTNLKDMELAPNRYLKTCYRFLDTSRYIDDKEVISTISELKNEGAEVIVVSEAYGVDDPSNELFVMERSDLPITAGHELTGLYGLEIRTLTATINASIMPKAINTANYVKSAVSEECISAPLMIMKGDGGITDMKSFQNKPISTILSGPAASIAGALLHLHILDGIFIEVGGTSTNICVIKGGRPETRYVTIMDYPTCIRSLDVRVAPVAGGSIIRYSGKKIKDVGPRSAHIAGLTYSCFADPKELDCGEIVMLSPKEGDPFDYVCIEGKGGKRFAITNTCAANALGLVPAGDYAYSNQESAKLSMSILSRLVGIEPKAIARCILEISTKKIFNVVHQMIKEYNLRADSIVLIGGGGGASILLPTLASMAAVQYKIAKDADVISSIGVAAAMIHEQREKTVNDPPKAEDISTLMDQVKQEALSRGAFPGSLIVQSEYINDRALLRATAIGNISLDIGDKSTKEIDTEEARVIACELFGINEGIQRIFDMDNYHVFACQINKKKLFLKSTKQPVVVLDKYGHVKLSVENAMVFKGNPKDVLSKVDSFLHQSHKRSNSNGLAPQIHLLDGINIIDFSSLTAPEYLSKAIHNELAKSTATDITAIVKL